MHEAMAPKLTKWPFVLADALLLGSAGWLSVQSARPLPLWAMGLIAGCVSGAALVGIVPFLLEYRALEKAAVAESLTTAVSHIQNLESIASQISGATGLWQTVQGQADKTAAAAQAIAERMGSEVQSFNELMQRLNDTEKATLRLEIDKLRRAEADWLQVLVRILDHVFALHVGALRSGQPNLVEQVGHFQNACREAARRVGLIPFWANPDEAFDPERHQVLEGQGQVPAGALIAETVATGYGFQGRLLRPALVRLQVSPESASKP